jgi:hypothetical protein
MNTEEKKHVLQKLKSALEKDSEDQNTYTDKEIIEQLRKTKDLQSFMKLLMEHVSVYNFFKESVKVLKEEKKTRVEQLIEQHAEGCRKWRTI